MNRVGKNEKVGIFGARWSKGADSVCGVISRPNPDLGERILEHKSDFNTEANSDK